ncbi:MAG: hypothetical protein ACLQK4_07985 [Acidimicrobiales bacterium]
MSHVAGVLTRIGVAVTVGLLAGVSAGCGGAPESPIHFRGNSSAAIPIAPGGIGSFSAPLDTGHIDQMTLISATLLVLPGFVTPRLVRLGVIPDTGEDLTSWSGWPIPQSQLDGHKVDRFSGAKIVTRPPRLGYPTIEYGLAPSSRDPIEATAGLRLTYVFEGQSYVGDIYSAGLICVVPSVAKITNREQERCDEASFKENNEVGKLVFG